MSCPVSTFLCKVSVFYQILYGRLLGILCLACRRCYRHLLIWHIVRLSSFVHLGDADFWDFDRMCLKLWRAGVSILYYLAHRDLECYRSAYIVIIQWYYLAKWFQLIFCQVNVCSSAPYIICSHNRKLYPAIQWGGDLKVHLILRALFHRKTFLF